MDRDRDRGFRCAIININNINILISISSSIRIFIERRCIWDILVLVLVGEVEEGLAVAIFAVVGEDMGLLSAAAGVGTVVGEAGGVWAGFLEEEEEGTEAVGEEGVTFVAEEDQEARRCRRHRRRLQLRRRHRISKR